MIVKCEKCESQFNLDEGLLKVEGSKVRCSVCKNVFTVYPPEQVFDEEEVLEDDFPDVSLEETVALESPPSLDEIEPEASDADKEESFDKVFEEALEEDVEEGETLTADLKPHGKREERTEILDERPDVDFVAPEGIFAGRGGTRSRLFLLSFIIILILIVSGLLVFFLAPGILPDSLSFLKPVQKEDITDTGIRQLTFEEYSGSFLQTNRLGQLFIIKGNVVNNYQKSRSFILLKGTIEDEEGKAIRQKLAYAGNIFTENELKDIELDEIDKAHKNQKGKGNINVDVAPGSSVPFMIIFENLPDNLGEFVVEPISSSPGN
jgi:predicted Zn finger-like uncharacterized protein